jgi:hypothetical protein
MDINRTVYAELSVEIGKPFVSILIGPRQVGKTFLMRQLAIECHGKGLKVQFHNLEDPDDLREYRGDEDQLIRQLKETDTDVLFLDEFHYLKNATRIFKVLYDSGIKVKIFASGSSSLEIHKHLKESLAGRFRLSLIHPLTGFELRQLPDYAFAEFLRFGGLPGLTHEEGSAAKMGLLKNVLQTYLLKDIKALVKEENVRAFNTLLYSLAQNQGQVVSVAALAREVGLSEPAIKHHLELMSQTYVCFPVDSYSRNLANELKKVKKYYLYDTGIRNCILSDYSPLDDRQDRGAIIESFVALAIIKQLKVNMEIKFWRTRQGDEVDFILLKNRIPVPVEVKYQLAAPVVPDGIRKFLQRYPDAPFALVFSKEAMAEVECCGRPVRFLEWQEAEEIEYLRSVE